MLENEPDGGAETGAAGQTTEERNAETVTRGAASRPPGPPSADAERAAGVEEVAERRAVPAVTFQPPMLVFQPPQAASREAGEATGRNDTFTGDAGHDAVRGEGRSAKGGADDGTDRAGKDASKDTGRDSGKDTDNDGDDRSGRRRRRRGGRGRGKGRDGENGGADDAAQAAERDGAPSDAATDAASDAPAGGGEQQEDPDQETQQAGSATSRRRRRRRRVAGEENAEASPDDPPDTVVKVREPRAADDQTSDDAQVRAVKGSTRLQAKKQRRREGRDGGRRRPSVLTESEFLARRESVERVMVVRQADDRTQIAVLEDGILVEHYVDRANHQSYVGNVYLGRVQNVLPSMEAAFVDIGRGRNAVLYAGEVNFDATGLEGQPKRIESALKSGQSLLVQVTKDPIGHKGARLTSQVSLPGRYLVYVPEGTTTGISRKLPDRERRRLKTILKQAMPDSAGVIVRTAAEGATEEELTRDIARLTAQWETVQRKSRTASPPSLLYGEPDLTVRVIRDVFNEDFTQLVVSGDDAWTMVDEYIRYVAPHLESRVRRWTENHDILSAYRVDEQLAKALDRKVWLPSGGSLVIERTEAMTVVDVNTGKFTGQGGNLEETVTKNNLEAAEELVRQLRLRDVGGIIVVDFIDMVLESNRELVLRRLLECLGRDRTKHQVAEVTSLGLVQMTRKRVGQGLLEAFSEPCECCGGRGLHVTLNPDEGKAAGSGRRRRRGTGTPDEASTAEATGAAEGAAEEQAERPVEERPQEARVLEEAPEETAEQAEETAEEAVQDAAAAAAEPAVSTLEPLEAEPVDDEPRRGRRRSRRTRAAVD